MFSIGAACGKGIARPLDPFSNVQHVHHDASLERTQKIEKILLLTLREPVQ
jgi:hypothetical protein